MKNKEALALKAENIELKNSINKLINRNESESIKKIPIDRICCDTVRHEDPEESAYFVRLAESIKQYGQIEPITVRKILSSDNDEKCLYSLISGYLRVKALKLLGEKYVMALLCPEKVKSTSEFVFISNDLRHSNTLFEKAEMINSIYTGCCKDLQLTADKTCLTKDRVMNYLNLLTLSDISKKMCMDYRLSDYQIFCVSRIKEEELLKTAIRHIGRAKLTSVETDDYMYDITGLESIITYAEPIKRKLILKDIRLLYNTIDNIVDTVKENGVPVDYKKEETTDGFNIFLKIKKIKSIAV